jgi:hypothetical protein
VRVPMISMRFRSLARRACVCVFSRRKAMCKHCILMISGNDHIMKMSEYVFEIKRLTVTKSPVQLKTAPVLRATLTQRKETASNTFRNRHTTEPCRYSRGIRRQAVPEDTPRCGRLTTTIPQYDLFE